MVVCIVVCWPVYCCSLVVCIVLVGQCFVVGYPCVLFFVGRVYCSSLALCIFVVLMFEFLLVGRVYCYWFVMCVVVGWPWVLLFVWLFVLFLFGCVLCCWVVV